MTRQTSYFMFGAAGVLVLGLCVGLVAYYGGGLPTLTASVAGPEELQYVPADATIVAYANIRDIMLSDFRQRFRDLEPDGDAQQEFQQRTGINLENDIDYVVSSVNPRSGQDEPGGIVLLRGRFNQVQLEALAQEQGGTVEEYRGTRVWFSQQPRDQGDRAPAGAFLEPGLVALGDEASVRRAIDLASSGLNVTADDELMALLGWIESGSNAWAVGRFDESTMQALLPNQMVSQIPALTRFAAGVRINGGMSGTLTADARDDEAGQNLRDVLTGFLALAKVSVGSRPELQPLLDSFQLSGVGTAVTMSFWLPSEVIELLLPAVGREVQ